MNDLLNHRPAYLEAIRLLARREYFSQELKIKLSQKGFSQKEIEQAIEECKRLGALNDEQVLARWIEKFKKQGKGPYFIIAKLKAKGIHLSPHDSRILSDQKEALKTFAEKKLKNKKLSEEKLFQMLLRRGFDAEDIKRYIDTQTT